MSAQRAWIVAIAGLLAVNVLACVVLAVLADRGGSQVIPNYYAKASRYDADMARAAASRKLGWQVSLVAVDGALEATLHDANGHALDGAVVRVRGYPRAHVDERLDLALDAVAARSFPAAGIAVDGARGSNAEGGLLAAGRAGEVPRGSNAGRYRGALPARRGWYDLVVDIDAGGAHDTRAFAVEAP